MGLSARERAKREDFDAIYRQAQLPVMRALERRTCGSDYGATSWATRDEADLIAAALALAPGVRLLEIGAGAGWPALYFAATSGCDVTLSDLPLSGLAMARERAARDGLAGRCRIALADAARLPFADASHDVVNQSDVLCCLVQKREVLAECRRAIRPGGRMACSLIHVPPGLSAGDHARAAETAPDFAETDLAYPVLFAAARWAICARHDLSGAFARSCETRLRAEEDLREALDPFVGRGDLQRHHDRMRRRIAALERGHLKRELFVLEAVGQTV